MGIRDTIKNISPPFLSNTNGEKFMYSFGLIIDAQVQRILTSTLSKFPLKSIPSALPYLGADRLITRGIFETDYSYAQRLSSAFTDWHFVGMPRAIMRQIIGWLSPKNPKVKLIDDKEQWFTYEDQTDTKLPPVINKYITWGWDGITNIWRFWVVVFINNVGVPWTQSSSAYGTFGKTWGDTTQSWGLSVPTTYTESLRNIIKQWSPAHSKCDHIIVALDNTKFNEYDSSTYPTDNKWGQYSKNDGTGVYIASRDSTARYIIFENSYASWQDEQDLT